MDDCLKPSSSVRAPVTLITYRLVVTTFEVEGTSHKRLWQNVIEVTGNSTTGRVMGSHFFAYQIWGFPKIRGTLSGVPVIRITVFGVYIGVSLFMKPRRALEGFLSRR